MNRRILDARESLEQLGAAAAALGRPVRFMEVCGTHTVNVFRSGLHGLLPSNVLLLSGPGCPVCVTSEADIACAADLARRPDVTLCTYGDMLRVPAADGRSLEMARAGGADVRVIYSVMDAVYLAKQCPGRQVVLVAVGFETTAPATAVAVLAAQQRGLSNFSVLVSHKRIVPAMLALLAEGDAGIDGFVCPGHVAVILGSDAFGCVVERHGISCVITGFEGPQIAAALARLCVLTAAGRAELDNLYPQAVQAEGNRHALAVMDRVFVPADADWRGFGSLPQSGLVLREAFAGFDARVRFDLSDAVAPGAAGCRCGDVITARCTPDACRLFGAVCTPVYPVGPCMVSSEGTCQAWFRYAASGRTRERALQPGGVS